MICAILMGAAVRRACQGCLGPGLWRDGYPQFNLLVAPVVLHERAVGISGSRQCHEWPHGRADARIRPGRVSGDPGPQIPATRQLPGIEPGAGRSSSSLTALEYI